MDRLALLRKVWFVSPEDASGLVKTAYNAVHTYNQLNQIKRVRLEPINWKKNSHPLTNKAGGQAEIDRQMLPYGSELMVAIFKDRLGAPVNGDPSGTAHEVRVHLEAGKKAMLYFPREHKGGYDEEELERLRKYEAECQKIEGLTWTYDDEKHLEYLLLQHLSLYMASFRTDSFAMVMSMCNEPDHYSDRILTGPQNLKFEPISLADDSAKFGYQVYLPKPMIKEDDYSPWSIRGTFDVLNPHRISIQEIWSNMGRDPHNSFKFFVRVRDEENIKGLCRRQLVEADRVVTGLGDADLNQNKEKTGLWRIWFLHPECYVHPYMSRPYMANHSIIDLLAD